MRLVAEPREVTVAPRSVARLARQVGPTRAVRLEQAADTVRQSMDGRRLWNLNSTAIGGGVAEMLELLVGYARGVGVDAHWVVIDGDAAFFAVTKRLHNLLHGAVGDGGQLGAPEAAAYDAILDANAAALRSRIAPGDVVVLHDPQTAGLVTAMTRLGAHVVWRCHIGTDRPNEHTRAGWDFLLPRLAECQSYVFSHTAFVPAELAQQDVRIIEPSIDPLSPKNHRLPKDHIARLLARIGLIPGESRGPQSFVLGDGGPFSPTDRMVLQVSRWDYLKDMLGVLHGFAEHVADRSDTRLALVGPSVAGVADDPEGAQVLTECLKAWEELPHGPRSRIRLVALPMDDVVANALMVNASQRHASVVVQKSLQEGFGLTVTEAMWKSRPVIASAVGGIVDQVPPGTGILLEDPADLDLFGRTLRSLLADGAAMLQLGRSARKQVRDHCLSDRHLVDYARLIAHVNSGQP